MSDPDSVAAASRLLIRLLGLAADDPSATTLAASAGRVVALVGDDLGGALFDAEPSHHARALAQGATR